MSDYVDPADRLRALADAKRSGEEREAADRAYRRNMAWLGKPVGTQSEFDLAPSWSPVDLSRVERDGFTAGKRGDRADSNSWTPGREEHQRWHSGWLRGQGEKVTAEIRTAEKVALGGDEGYPLPTEPTRRRGRPKGSPNKPKVAQEEQDVVVVLDQDGNVYDIEPNDGVPAQANGAAAPADLVAQSIGREDGAAGHQDHAARYPFGHHAHADYWTGHTEGKASRLADGPEAA